MRSGGGLARAPVAVLRVRDQHTTPKHAFPCAAAGSWGRDEFLAPRVRDQRMTPKRPSHAKRERVTEGASFGASTARSADDSQTSLPCEAGKGYGGGEFWRLDCAISG